MQSNPPRAHGVVPVRNGIDNGFKKRPLAISRSVNATYRLVSSHAHVPLYKSVGVPNLLPQRPVKIFGVDLVGRVVVPPTVSHCLDICGRQPPHGLAGA